MSEGGRGDGGELSGAVRDCKTEICQPQWRARGTESAIVRFVLARGQYRRKEHRRTPLQRLERIGATQHNMRYALEQRRSFLLRTVAHADASVAEVYGRNRRDGDSAAIYRFTSHTGPASARCTASAATHAYGGIGARSIGRADSTIRALRISARVRDSALHLPA